MSGLLAHRRRRANFFLKYNIVSRSREEGQMARNLEATLRRSIYLYHLAAFVFGVDVIIHSRIICTQVNCSLQISTEIDGGIRVHT